MAQIKINYSVCVHGKEGKMPPSATVCFWWTVEQYGTEKHLSHFDYLEGFFGVKAFHEIYCKWINNYLGVFSSASGHAGIALITKEHQLLTQFNTSSLNASYFHWLIMTLGNCCPDILPHSLWFGTLQQASLWVRSTVKKQRTNIT